MKRGQCRNECQLNFDSLFKQLPEQELWRLLQDVIASEVELADATIQQLDDRMQGFLFLQEYVTNREARIEFARTPAHMPYLRDAAGSCNVWMDDEEFTGLVSLDDPVTLACFGRSEKMKPHHLAYIEHKLAVHPHRQELLATSYDTTITLKKALERQGSSWELTLFRLAKAVLEGTAVVGSLVEDRAPGIVVDSSGDPRALWRAYLNLKNLDETTLCELLLAAGLSTSRPVRASAPGIDSIH
jgi:hypothetical protein